MADWGVRVNEVGIFANRQGIDWWLTALAPWELSGRAVCLAIGPFGCVWFLPCADKDEAVFARDHIISHGVHRGFVKIMTAAGAERQRLKYAASAA